MLEAFADGKGRSCLASFGNAQYDHTFMEALVADAEMRREWGPLLQRCRRLRTVWTYGGQDDFQIETCAHDVVEDEWVRTQM